MTQQRGGGPGCEDAERRAYFRRLELVVQNTTNMVIVTNRAREIEWVNPAYTKVCGWTLDEVKGKNPRAFLHGPATSAPDAMRLGALLRKGQPVKDFELLNYTKAGKPYWVSLSIEPIFDDQGQVTQYVAIQSDVTERKRRDAEMARLLRTLGEAQRIAKVGIMEHDLASGRVACSDELFQIMDAPEQKGELPYETLMLCTHPDDLDHVRQSYETAINGGGPYESEHRIFSKSGRVKWVHLRGVLEGWDDGTPALCRLTVQDVTERKQAEQLAREKELLEQVSKTQIEMLARVSHELRTPLHALLGFADMVERMEAQRMSERSRGHLGHIRRSARHLLLIVNDILDLTRLRERRLPLALQPTTVRPVVDEVLSLLEPMAAARGITVRVDHRGEAGLAAMADRQRLVQVLINLVGNAIKYNRPSGQIVVRIESTREGQVSVAVQDTGVGIGAQHLARIFEPFYRADDDRPERPGTDSSGLGLAIAKTLALAMQGDMHVHSEPGVGSTFTLSLQQAPAGTHKSATEAANAPVLQQAHTDAGAAASVLYIDDNEVNRCLVESYLQARPDISLVTCATGAQGLAAARRMRPTLMLVDLQLPDMSGHDVLRTVLDDPALHRIPCVAFSADAREQAVEEAIRGGFREFLPKPIDVTEFLSAIDRLIADETGPGCT